MRQTTDTILMIRPVNFRANEQTALNNHYQKEVKGKTQEELQQKAEQEFNAFVLKLKAIGVQVLVVNISDNL